MHEIAKMQRCRVACCTFWGNRAEWHCNCIGHGHCRLWDSIHSRWWMVLHALGPHVARGFLVREAPHSVNHRKCRAYMLIPAAISLWIEPDWNALGLWKVSYTDLSLACMILVLPQLSGYRNQTNGRFPTAKVLVPQCLNACKPMMIRKFFWKTWRYINAYKKGLNAH